jgi:hypothetical protein
MQDIRHHIEQKLEQATLEHSPFPHIIIENFFPEDVYAKIMGFNLFKFNTGVEWLKKIEKSSPGMRGPYHARKQINFGKDEEFAANSEALAFWDNIQQCFLQGDWFPRVIFKTYKEYFQLRFGDIVHDEDFFQLFSREFFLQRHEPGYYIGPHTDLPARVFTCIFSFAESAGFEEYGTLLMQHRDRFTQCWGLDHYTPENFVTHKVAPYKPNNFLLFFKTRYSFHAVKEIPATIPNQRYGMQFQYYEPMGGLFKDLSRPDLMIRTAT